IIKRVCYYRICHRCPSHLPFELAENIPAELFMTKIFPTVLVIALASLPVFAQSSSYSIDNFDIRNGVRVQQPQATPRIASSKAGRTKKNPPSRSAATDAIGIADEGASHVKPTVMLTGPL